MLYAPLTYIQLNESFVVEKLASDRVVAKTTCGHLSHVA